MTDERIEYLPPFLNNGLLALLNYVPYTLYSTAFQTLNTITPILRTITTGSFSSASILESFSLTQILLLLLALYFSLQLVRYTIGYVVSWLYFLLRLALWAGALFLALQIYRRGADGTLSWAESWFGELAHVFKSEYERYSDVGAGGRGRTTHTGYRRYTDSLYGQGARREPAWPGWGGR